MPPNLDHEAGRAFSFGSFQLHEAQKQLTHDGAPIRLGSRAFELLLALVERPGEVLSRQELESRIWPHTVVEETSLRVHIAALRKALRDGINGARYIANIPGRGYCFVAPVRVHPPGREPAVVIALAANRAVNNLPPRLSKIVGRKEAIEALAEHLRVRQFVSLVGPGGIGKTTVAIATAAESIARYEHGAVFVDLAPLTVADLVASTVALALGCQHASGPLLPQICEFVRDRRLLLVLDNCEHVIAAAAHLVESVMAAAPDIRILATSREPLFAEGEWVVRLPALQAPQGDDEITQESAGTYPAIRLFMDRAEANAGEFRLSAETLPSVLQLCHRLDGIPLAIELAAARVGSLGVQGLAQRLDELFKLLNRGRRTAMPRHQTLDALLDWSFALLTEREKTVLRRLSVFRAFFSLHAAVRVLVSDDIGAAEVMECVSSLTLKSLVHVDASGEEARFRLLYMTRAYAAGKLAASGEARALQLRHAQHFLEVAGTASEHWGFTGRERLATFSPLIDDLRSAVDWAFSDDGDDRIGVALVSVAWMACIGLGLFGEFRERVDLALERASHFVPRDPQAELALCVCWSFLSCQSRGMDGPAQAAMFDRVLALAAETPDVVRQVEALYAVATGYLGQGRYDAVKHLMARVHALASRDLQPLSVLLGDRLLVLVHHHLGEHASARQLARKVLRQHAEPRHAWFIGQVPRSVSMVITEARILWLEGASDRASELARQAVENAIGEHPYALAQALALAAIPIALWRGDEAAARDLTRALHEHATRHSLLYWQSWALGYDCALDLDPTAPGKHDPISCDWASSPSELDMLVTLAPGFLSAATLERVEQGVVAWCGPEVLRAEAVRLLHVPAGAGAAQARALLLRALEMARHQGALAWELRVATTLAAACAGGQGKEMVDLLAATIARFSEGLQTRDLLLAKSTLAELVRDGASEPSLEPARSERVEPS